MTVGRLLAGNLPIARISHDSEGVVLRQMVRAARMDRSFYTSLLYDGYATGNAVLVVAAVGLIPALRSLSLVVIASAAVWSILRASIVAVAVWASGVYLFRRYGDLPVTFRMVGFANVALILIGVIPWLGSLWIPLTIASAVWFFFALRIVASAQFDLSHPEDSFVAASGVLGWYVGIILFPSA